MGIEAGVSSPGHDAAPEPLKGAGLRLALTELDRAIADKPHVEGHTFSVAVRHLAQVRNQLALEARAADAPPSRSAYLEQVNAAISVVLAGHFPLGGVPWPELQKTRDRLADMVRRMDAAGDAG